MDFKLGLKLKQVPNELDVLISKDELVQPLFTTQEIDSMFILTSHLKGYGKRDIKIEINEDGSRITISGKKPVQETLMVNCEVVKKQVEMRGFRKMFKIPEGVVVDKVKARLDEDESRLTIRMPKSVNGIVGVGIQELEEIPSKGVRSKQEDDHDEMAKDDEEIVQSKSELKQEKEVIQNDKNTNEVKPDSEIQKEVRQVDKIEEKINNDDIEEKKPVASERSSIMCTPIIAGSALLASFIVVVLTLIRSKSESSKKRN